MHIHWTSLTCCHICINLLVMEIGIGPTPTRYHSGIQEYSVGFLSQNLYMKYKCFKIEFWAKQYGCLTSSLLNRVPSVPSCLTCPTCPTCPRARVPCVPYVPYVPACPTCLSCPTCLTCPSN